MSPLEWLEPWSSVEGESDEFRAGFRRQLEKEMARGHPLRGVPVELLARGNGDDCLFRLLDGTGRVAEVHLVWQGRQSPPWPMTTIHADAETWRRECMEPEHREWTAK